MEWSASKTAFRERLGKIWLFIAFLLVSILAFEAGWLKRSLAETAPLIITTPTVVPAEALPEWQASGVVQSAISPSEMNKQEVPASCSFVGSKKSNKYHLPSSRCAKQIKAENRLCFDSVEGAKTQGYLPGCLE
ncbi:MAG: hypothetical protein WAT81_04025 [Candidatus Moraniibacteriota bacterium]